MSLTKPRAVNIYKPFHYPWAYDFWKRQQAVHWLPEESPLADDVKDWKTKLSDHERNLLTHIFRFFTQSDIEIQDCYHTHYQRFFKPTEIKMMLTAFANMETIHIAAYSHLLDTLGMPETTYSQFLEYKAMKDKFDWLHSFNSDGDPLEIAASMAAFSGATEGMSLFASFAILLNFPRHNKMRGMGDLITWSVRDESLHCEGISKLFTTYCGEEGLIGSPKLAARVDDIFDQAVVNEDAFIDLAFEMGPVENLTPEEMKKYIRYIADIRRQQLGFAPQFKVSKNPLPWLSFMLNGAEYGNFFESRVTDYSKAVTEGEWDEDAYDF